jgi:S-adenosylmethionine:tRNA ribosyltransferase-isomerase
VPLGGEISLEPLQPPDRLVHQPVDLGEVPRDRQDLLAKAVLDGALDLDRERSFELRSGLRERLELRAGALERGLDAGGLRPAFGQRPQPLRRLLDCRRAHRARRYRVRRTVKASELDYELPQELIAQRPLERRDESRLLVYDRETREVRHRRFFELQDELDPDTLVVVNDTRVLPARIPIERPRGEVLLLEQMGDDGLWEGLARPTRRLRAGRRYGPVELVEHLGEGRWSLRLEGAPRGEAPLPPYITERLDDPERYQTVYAEEAGSAAAPTAGLHFTPELLERLDAERVTLHVGLDTFRPITADDLADHRMHSERYEVSASAWESARVARHVLAVGTTTVRVLESLARGAPLAGRTDLFITPGFEFKRVDSLLTNFHLPRSTLLALVMAFAGVEETRRLYRIATEERYRFYSFGDAMLVR